MRYIIGTVATVVAVGLLGTWELTDRLGPWAGLALVVCVFILIFAFLPIFRGEWRYIK
jgi:hypothetical protein